MTLLRPFLDRWRLCALLAAVAMLSIAHAFQTFGGYAPCTLCLRQREVYWTALGLALGFMVLVRLPGGPRWRELTCWVLGLVFAVSVGLAVYHAGAEWKFWPGPEACASSGAGVNAAALNDFLAGEKVRPPACDEAPWVFAGLSMAGWNALISMGLVALSVLAALRERSKR
ncbi:disulfide bond formation protein B [Phenylobacterium sp. VNQ135]|uniref:disulfide bond formation protein B n=1 Tax=Phenylobacterium sp. VNQ135 TaxID=3400922 RepID=UPI003C010D44